MAEAEWTWTADGLHVRRRQGEKRGWNVRGYGAAESGAHLHQVSGHLGSRSHTTTRCNETVDQDQEQDVGGRSFKQPLVYLAQHSYSMQILVKMQHFIHRPVLKFD